MSIFDETGKRLLAQSPPIPHDEGSPAPIVFSAVGTEKGVWGMKVENVRLYITPLSERPDYLLRKETMEVAKRALSSDDVRRLWLNSEKALKRAERAFKVLSRVPLDDWSAYVRALRDFDGAMQELAEQYHERVVSRLPKERKGWRMLDLWEHFNCESSAIGIAPPPSAPVVEIRGIPFIALGFGKNCLFQDMSERSERAIRLDAMVSKIALLIAPKFDAELYSRDDSLVDVLQVELRYADGFVERIVPVPVGWEPPLPEGIGRPPMKNCVPDAYLVVPGHTARVTEVVMCDDTIRAGWVLFALSYSPGRPREVPIIRGQRLRVKLPPKKPAKPVKTAEGVGLRNPWVALLLDRERGILRSLWGAFCGELVRPERPSPIFAVKLNERLIYSDEFAVVEAKTFDRPEGARIFYRLRGPGADGPLEFAIEIEGGNDGALKWKATVKNVSTHIIKPRIVFPLLDGLDFGKHVGWYFPQRGGAVSTLPLEGLSSYGGMAWLQILDAYRADGGGLYLRCDDTTGLYKIFAFRSSPDEKTKPRRVANIPTAAHPVDPWRPKVGVHMSIQYLERALKPGQSWSPPQATICVHPGDWREALSDYRKWLKTWWRQLRPCPERFRYGFYALVGGPPRDDQRGEEFGSYDWWHLNLFWSIDYPDELRDELEWLKKQAERAKRWGQAVGIYMKAWCWKNGGG